MHSRLLLAVLGWLGWSLALAAAPVPGVFLEDLTSVELRQALDAGRVTTAIVPVGGTEQNGAHLTLGKHNARVRILAGRIAAALGDAVVAPVIAYVPEGDIDPPSAHMRRAGTISVPEDAFKAVVAAAARSLRAHGFAHIVLIGDHGGYQGALADVAARLERERPRTGSAAHVHYIAAYYRTSQREYVEALRRAGLTTEQIGTHAGAADTALSLAVDPASVHPERYPRDVADARALGVTGDPRAARAALGESGADLIVSATVAAIRRATRPP